MPAPAIRYDGHAVDLSGRFFSSTAITGSPALAAETIVCTLTIGENVSLQQAAYLFASVAFTVGTSGTGATLRIRQTNTSGTVLYTTGAQTVVATNLWETAGQGIDTAGVFPGQVYVATLQITAGAAVSTVSAASLIAMVVQLGALKPGWKTTEFVATVATAVGLIFASSADWLPPRYAAIGAAISAGAYAVSRGLAKINPPKDSSTPTPS